MPIGSTDKTLLETHPHVTKFYLVVHQPETVLAALVNGVSTGDPITSIPFDNVSAGAWGNVEAGQTLLIGSTAGAHDKGIVRVRSATSTILTIAESSDLRIIEDDDFLTVLREHRFWIKYPRIVSLTEMYEDYDIAWTNENTTFGPIPMMGPPAFVFLDAATVDIDYDFSDSYPIAGASISSYATTYQYGDAGVSATSTHTETYSAATGMAGSETKLTITDNNGKTAIGWRQDFVLARSGANAPITDFFIETPIKGSWAGNEDVDFVLYGNAAQTDIRDGAHVWIIFESWYGSTNKEISLEYSNRANILFEGWVIKDSINRGQSHSMVRFTAQPITKMMEDGKAYPSTLEVATTPTIWYQVATCSTVKAALFLCKWRSTLSEITDINIPSSYTETSGEDWKAGTIKAQLETALSADVLSVVQHKTGMLYFEKRANMMGTAERANLDLALILESKHWRSPLSIPEESTPLTNYTLFEGVAYDGDTGLPYFSEAPGLAAKYRGSDGGKIDRLAIVDQDHLNQLSGDFLAMKNAKYPNLPVELTGFWPVVDCVPQRRYRVAIAAADTNRGVNISGYNFVVDEWQIQIDQKSGLGNTSIGLSEETDGEDGRSVTYKTDPPPVVVVPRPGPYIPPYSPPPYTPVDTGRRIFGTSLGVYVCDDVASPRWYSVNQGFSTADDKWVWCTKRDPWHWWTSGGKERTLWAITKSGVWKHLNFPTGTWTQVLSLTSLASAGMTITDVNVARLNLSIEVDNRIAFIFYNKSSGLSQRQYVVVANNAVIANYYQVYLTNDGIGFGDVIFAPHSAGNTIYAAGNRAPGHGGSSEAKLWKSVTMGGSWSNIDTIGVNSKGSFADVSIPYISASNPDLYVLWGRGPGAPTEPAGSWSISSDAGASFSIIPGTVSRHSGIGTGGVQSRIWLPSYLPALAAVPSKYSIDTGTSWTSLPLVPGVDVNNWVSAASFANWDGDSLLSVLIGAYAAATTNLVWLWEGGATWVNKTANLGSFGSMIIYSIDRDSMGVA